MFVNHGVLTEDNKKAGTMGNYLAFILLYHHMSTIEGGMVLNNEEYRNKMLKSWKKGNANPNKKKYWVEKYRVNEKFIFTRLAF